MSDVLPYTVVVSFRDDVRVFDGSGHETKPENPLSISVIARRYVSYVRHRSHRISCGRRTTKRRFATRRTTAVRVDPYAFTEHRTQRFLANRARCEIVRRRRKPPYYYRPEFAKYLKNRTNTGCSGTRLFVVRKT